MNNCMVKKGITLDKVTIERILDFFDMSADGEIDKGEFEMNE